MEKTPKREQEDVQSGPVTHGGEGDPLGGGVAEPGENEGLNEEGER